MSAQIALSADLRWLVYSVLVCLLLWPPYVVCLISVRGLARAIGYPTGDYGDLPDWAQRCHRAHLNLLESLAPFAALVLTAHVIGAANETTALAALVFFWARLVQAVVHIAAIPGVRTLSFVVGWIASLVIMWEILL